LGTPTPPAAHKLAYVWRSAWNFNSGGNAAEAVLVASARR
jgi:hypothetical protein